MSSFIDPIWACDWYKVGHKDMYPENTQMIYSNFTPRSSKYATTSFTYDGVVNFGLQGFIKSFLIESFNEQFFNQPKEKIVAKYQRRCDQSLGAGVVSADHIAALHDLGYLPIGIAALPEGVLVPSKVPVLVIWNTHEDFAWLVNYLETALSAELWKASTIATIAVAYRVLFERYAIETGAPLEFVDWQGHDFSLRGQGSLSDAAACAGHLISFLGSDTCPAFDYLEEYYDGMNTFVGGSVPATEHSVMCAGGKDDEVETIRRLITQVVPRGVVSVVSDTWDFWNVITNTAEILKEDILNRQVNDLGMAKVVFRPDSGNPADILCGYTVLREFYNMTEFDNQAYHDDKLSDAVFYTDGPVAVKIDNEYFEIEIYDSSYGEFGLGKKLSYDQVRGAVQCLWDVFGGTKTEKGFKVLNERVGLIYGDSITLRTAQDILKRLKNKGFASCNVVFGIGSYTYQYNTRDTYGFAMKATFAIVDGEARELSKDPITDNGTKKSAKGLLTVVKSETGEYVLKDSQTFDDSYTPGELEVVFANGVLEKEVSLETIRQTVKESIAKLR